MRKNSTAQREMPLGRLRNIMENRRKISSLIPYRVRDNKIFVYLQKRAKDAKGLPDLFGFFGGGVEGNENPEETLRREIKEELDFVLESFVHFKKYEFNDSIQDTFFLEVEDDFDEKIKVLEGEYGKWLSEQEVLSESKFVEDDRVVLKEFYGFLRAQK